MKKNLEILINSFSDYIKIFPQSSITYKDGIHILNSETSATPSNIMIVEDFSILDKKKFILDNFNKRGLIFHDSKSIESSLVDIYSDKVFYIGEYPIMERNEVETNYSAPYYDNLYIENNKTKSIVNNHFKEIFLSSRGLEDMQLKIDKKENIHIFVCYMNDKPVGFLSAVSFQESAFVVEAYVKTNYRNYGVLTALSQYAKEYGLSHGIYNFYSIATSEHTVNVIANQGHMLVDTVHMWEIVE